MKNKIKELKQAVLSLNHEDFNQVALEIFKLQSELNPVYRDFVSKLGIKKDSIRSFEQIPCMPISFFKNHKILLDGLAHTMEFHSSGTTGQTRSIKHIADIGFYDTICQRGFERQFGSLKDFALFALLPNYLENPYSSLIYMIKSFLNTCGREFGGFYNTDFEKLEIDLQKCPKEKKPMLWGVSYALLDFVKERKPDLSEVLLFETGGMKGRKKELTREELHEILKEYSGTKVIYSEYGMTELMSQAYSDGSTKFKCLPWMKIRIKELNDPFSEEKTGRIGSIDIIDLANIETCSFIASEDLGRAYEDGTFEVLGRKDQAEIRGCNLMMN